jgi:hypothetical protein
MTSRRASCCCGQLHLSCEGEPIRVSICHCLACQQRTGSVFGTQARYHRDRVTIEGRATEYVRIGDEGNEIIFRFCPVCGSTVYWQLSGDPELIAVAVGAFADPQFPAPQRSVYNTRRHAWAVTANDAGLKHLG